MPSLGAVVADGPDRTQKRGGSVEREVVETSQNRREPKAAVIGVVGVFDEVREAVALRLDLVTHGPSR